MITLHVAGMSCGHCVKIITELVNCLNPRARLEADLATSTVTAGNTAVKVSLYWQAICIEGYEVTQCKIQ